MINLILAFDVFDVVGVTAALHKESENYLWLLKVVDTQKDKC